MKRLSWLESGRDKSKPFFLFVCYHEPHEPIASAKEFAQLYPSDDPSYSAHHGNISQMDAAFGRLIKSLDRLSVRDDTFVLFTSDNGPAITGMHPHGSAGPLRDKKGAVFDGGIRVPGIVQWPGRLKAGSVSDEPVSGVDVLPTLCEIAGVDIPSDRVLDGVSFLPVLNGQKVDRSKPLYWQFNRSRSDAKVAVRSGRWKLVASLDVPDPKPSGGIPEGEMQAIKMASLTDFRLFDLSSDIAEESDVAERFPDQFNKLRNQMTEMYREVVAEAPVWPVWEWPRYESKRIQWPDYWLNRRK